MCVVGWLVVCGVSHPTQPLTCARSCGVILQVEEARTAVKDRRYVRDKYLRAVTKYKRLKSHAIDAARAAGLPKPAVSQAGEDFLALASELLEQEAESEMSRGRSGSVTEALHAGLGAIGRRSSMQIGPPAFMGGLKSMFRSNKSDSARRAAEAAVAASSSASRDCSELEQRYRVCDVRQGQRSEARWLGREKTKNSVCGPVRFSWHTAASPYTGEAQANRLNGAGTPPRC